MKTLLTIDIGNTNIVLGIYRGSKLISKRYIPTKRAKIPYRRGIDSCIISSVVPKALRNIKRCAKKICGRKVFVLGENIKAPIKNRYKRPKQVGQDRLANGAALYNNYGGGIVVDFGTAVTFDVISKKGEYLGGIIFPGIRLSLENLSLKAALLPKIRLKETTSLLGKDTEASMRSGILNGYGALCDGIIKKLRSKYGRNLPAIATGGDAPLLSRYCPSIDKIDLNLTLKGLLITYQNQMRP